jgi:formylglycine-generating enzyme required for sulfatase activity
MKVYPKSTILVLCVCAGVAQHGCNSNIKIKGRSCPCPTDGYRCCALTSMCAPAGEGCPNSWVSVPAGDFWMGSPGDTTAPVADAGPDAGLLSCPLGYHGACTQEVKRDVDEHLHLVRLSRAIRMQATEVTQEQFRAVAGFNPSVKVAGQLDHPVNGVSWFDALVFANLLSQQDSLLPCYELTDVLCAGYGSVSDGGESCFRLAQNVRVATVRLHAVDSPYACQGYRLPTEAEWERAARGVSATMDHREMQPFDGDVGRDSALDQVAWYDVDRAGIPALEGPHVVAGKQPNVSGLYDMQGNVWEWVWDTYAPYASDDVLSPLIDPTGPDIVKPTDERGIRGGSWGSWGEYCRIPNRGSAAPDGLLNGVDQGTKGFRLVRTALSP